MKVSAQYAKAHFPDLIEAASNGDEVEIDIPDKPTVKLVVVYPPSLQSKRVAASSVPSGTRQAFRL